MDLSRRVWRQRMRASLHVRQIHSKSRALLQQQLHVLETRRRHNTRALSRTRRIIQKDLDTMRDTNDTGTSDKPRSEKTVRVDMDKTVRVSGRLESEVRKSTSKSSASCPDTLSVGLSSEMKSGTMLLEHNLQGISPAGNTSQVLSSEKKPRALSLENKSRESDSEKKLRALSLENKSRVSSSSRKPRTPSSDDRDPAPLVNNKPNVQSLGSSRQLSYKAQLPPLKDKPQAVTKEATSASANTTSARKEQEPVNVHDLTQSNDNSPRTLRPPQKSSLARRQTTADNSGKHLCRFRALPPLNPCRLFPCDLPRSYHHLQTSDIPDPRPVDLRQMKIAPRTPTTSLYFDRVPTRLGRRRSTLSRGSVRRETSSKRLASVSKRSDVQAKMLTESLRAPKFSQSISEMPGNPPLSQNLNAPPQNPKSSQSLNAPRRYPVSVLYTSGLPDRLGVLRQPARKETGGKVLMGRSGQVPHRTTIQGRLRGLRQLVHELRDKHEEKKPRDWTVNYGVPMPRHLLRKPAVPV